MSLGRKAIQKTLETLKQNSLLGVGAWLETSKNVIEAMNEIKPTSAEETAIALQFLPIVTMQSNVAHMVVRNLLTYIDALEAYVSELDETFDEALESAKKRAEEEAKKQPKFPKDLYR